MMQTLSSTRHKARKRHRCSWCGLIIEVGETYSRSSHIDGCDFWEWKGHLSCDQLVRAMKLEDEGDGITQDDFHEAVGYFACDVGIAFGTFPDKLNAVKKLLLTHDKEACHADEKEGKAADKEDATG
jgi:hypothetical protein